MTDKDLDVYKELQLHIDKFPIGFPTTKSGVEFEILKHFFTPKEAKIAIKLNFSWSRDLEALETIYERVRETGMSIKELEKLLDDMSKKGVIHSKREGENKHYANALFMYGMYELQVNNLTKDLLVNTMKYINEAFGLEAFGTKIPQFRTVPVEQSVNIEHQIPTYDDLRLLIENVEGPIMVSNCLCRQATDLLGNPCKLTDRRETHLGFGHLAQFYIDQGKGRQINKDEALEILRKNEDDGLVLQAGNSLKPQFFCSCCGCCCPVLNGLKQLPRPVQFISANYYAEVNPESCEGCETCIDRCQMGAIKLVKEKAKVNKKKCIGCGNCVLACPEKAISLQKKKEEIDPAPTMDDLYEKILAKKQQLKGK